MNNRAKAVTLILIVLIIISLSLGGGIYSLFQKERARNVSLQSELDSTIVKYKKAESQLYDANNQITSLTVQVNDAQGKVEGLTAELNQEKADKKDVLAKIDQLTADLDQLKVEKSDLENKLTQAQEDALKVVDKLTELKNQKIELEAKLKDFESKTQGVELGTIVVNQENAPVALNQAITQSLAEQPGQGKEGKVLVVNRDYNFVVINLGSKDAIDVGDVFSIYHNNKNIGEIKVEKVHESMAAAGFSSGDIKDKVSEGDKVVQKVK